MIDLPKQDHMNFEPLGKSDCKNEAALVFHIVYDTQSDAILKHIHKEICQKYTSLYVKLIQDVQFKKQMIKTK